VNPAAAAEQPPVCQLILPARSPYDRQLLVQSIRRTAGRWGAARVALGRSVLLVVQVPRRADARCADCGACAGLLHWRRGQALACGSCALAAALGAAEWAAVEPRTIEPDRPVAPPQPHSETHSRRGDAKRPSRVRHRQ
jgi:hypothetical protein